MELQQLRLMVPAREPPFPHDWRGKNKDKRACSRRTIVRRVSKSSPFPSSAFYACDQGVPDGFAIPDMTFQEGEIMPETISSLQSSIDQFSTANQDNNIQLNFFQLVEYVSINNKNMTPYNECFKPATPTQLLQQKQNEQTWKKENKAAKVNGDSVLSLRMEDFGYGEVIDSLTRVNMNTPEIQDKLKELDKKGRKRALTSSSSSSSNNGNSSSNSNSNNNNVTGTSTSTETPKSTETNSMPPPPPKKRKE